MQAKEILSKLSLTKHETKKHQRERFIRMESLPDEDAGLVFWEDYCDLHNWPRMPTSAKIHQYAREFVSEKNKEIRSRWTDVDHIDAHDLLFKPVARFMYRSLAESDSHSRNDPEELQPRRSRPTSPKVTQQSRSWKARTQCLQQQPSLNAAAASFATLPPELHFMIAALLTRKQDLYSCTLVSRDWHQILNPILWNNIEDDCPSEIRIRILTFVDKVLGTGSLQKYGHLIQTLKIKCRKDDLELFMDEAPDKFSRLHSIELIGNDYSDDVIANLLRQCSRQCGGVGPRRVVFNIDDCLIGEKSEIGFGPESARALKDHFPTLEVLRAEGAVFSSKEIKKLLCSTPKLREFNILPKDPEQAPWLGFPSSLRASDTAHPNWACTSLVVFGCPVTGIPYGEYGKLMDCVQQKRIELHKSVYSQLARLTHLEELRLGTHYDPDNMDSFSDDYDEWNDRQYDCLSMTLESGLDMLKRLKNLRVVDLEGMDVGIDGEGEQKWVAEHWPKASVLTSSDDTEEDGGGLYVLIE
ncbi:hypothetical protein EMPS_02130 [Entomortierella parvispora]|uniref:F-box domain-containing protein n=1 Tax=Entomortierella parvispora TaxID=205924 RepID=A0A9P3H4V1_9FUNG|nr:hypothetical protein EMPS_02130 [Entomortierella parvispora]